MDGRGGRVRRPRRAARGARRPLRLRRRRQRDLHRLLLRASLEDEGDPGAGVDRSDLADLRRRKRAGEVAAELDPAFVLLALQAVAAAGIVFPGDVRRLTGRDPGSEAFARWYAQQVRALVARLAD